MNTEILACSYISGGYFDGKVHLIYRDEVGKKKVCSFPQKREVFIRTQDESRVRRSELYRMVKGLTRDNLGRYTRVKVGWQEDYEEFARMCRANGIEILEGDVRPLRRALADYDLKVSTVWRCLFIDLETEDDNPNFAEKETWRILSCSFATLEGRKFHFVATEISDEAERELLVRIMRVIIAYDVVLAWNGDNFDFEMLHARCKYHNIDFPWWQVNFLDMMKVYKKYSGRDDVKTSFALDAVGENVLGIRKLDRTGIIDMFMNNRHLLQMYNDRDVEIMVKLELAKGFVALHLQICAICHTFPNKQSLFSSELMDGLMLRRAREAGHHYSSKSYDDSDNEGKFEGAYVMEPVVGFHHGVSVFDFASLYPSIIISFNMSPETVLRAGSHPRRCVHCGMIDPPGPQYKCKHCKKSIISSPFSDSDGMEITYSTAPTGVSFRTDRVGLVPEALIELIAERGKVKKQMKGVEKGTQAYLDLFNKSTALKVLANSFYGQLGAPFTRYYVREVAESVTLSAQHFIKLAIEKLTAKGYHVIYGDTDSCFVCGEPEELKAVVDNLNRDVFVEEMTRMRCKEFRLNFSYEKRYKNYLIVAKKNYAGWIEDMEGEVPKPHKKLKERIDTYVAQGILSPDIEGTLDVKGLEMMRGDRIAIARELQQLVILMLVRDGVKGPEKILEQARKYRNRFEENVGISADDLVISKSISKHPNSYAGNPNVHVRLAKEMIAKGLEVFPGMKIRYIITDGKSPAKAIRYEEFKGEYDRVHYWNNQTWPPAVRVLEVAVPNYPWASFTLSGKGGLIQRDLCFFKGVGIPPGVERKRPGVPVESMRIRGSARDIRSCTVYLAALSTESNMQGLAMDRMRAVRSFVDLCPGKTELKFDVMEIDDPASVPGVKMSLHALTSGTVREIDPQDFDRIGVSSSISMSTPHSVDYPLFYKSLVSQYGDESFLLGIVPTRG